MANDIDMWNDIEELENSIDRNGDSKDIKEDETKAELLTECYQQKFIEFEDDKAEELKQKFQDTYGFWGNYY